MTPTFMNRNLVSLAFCFIVCLGFGQQQETDSLKNVLKGKNLPDTTRVNILIELCTIYRESNLDTSLYFATQSYEISKKLRFIKGEGKALNCIGLINKDLGELGRALQFFTKAVQSFKRINDKNREANGYNNIGLTWDDKGEQNNAMSFYEQALAIYDSLEDFDNVGYTFTNMAQSERKHGNYLKAIELYLKALTICESRKEDSFRKLKIEGIYGGLGIVFEKMEKYEEAISYYTKSLEIKERKGLAFGAAVTKANLGSLYLLLGKYGKAEQYTLSALHFFKSINFTGGIASTLSNLADAKLKMNQLDSAHSYYVKAHELAVFMGHKEGISITLNGLAEVDLNKKNFDKAIDNALKARKTAKENHIIEQESTADKILSEAYIGKADYKNGYDYYLQYSALKDSTFNRGKLQRLFSLEKEYEVNRKQTEIDLLKNQNQIKELSLGKEKVVRYFLIAGIVFILVLSGVVYKAFKTKLALSNELEIQNKEIKAQNEEISLQSELIESINKDLKVQALRAQMNPHFIFNSLNSIQFLIMKNETVRAFDYLTKFAQLLRRVMDNSDKNWISLDEEVSLLKLYLELESLRFDKSFSYEVKVEGANVNGFKIPPMVVQPYIENAILHGLMPKGNDRQLRITFSGEGNQLHCEVWDNGIGRAEAIKISERKNKMFASKGMNFTSRRLQVLSTMHKEKSEVLIVDRMENERPAGTSVTLSFEYA